MAKIRVLDAANRTMQRLGFLKLLCARAAMFETNNLPTLGHHLIETVTRPVREELPLPTHLLDYIRVRLTDSTCQELRKQVLANGGPSKPITLEIQDVYLAAPDLPSRTGKLVDQNWRRYPSLGTALDLLRKGTYSALTRSLVLLRLTPNAELDAFERVDSSANPFRLSREQALFFLYSLIDNDAEVLFPFMIRLLEWEERAIPEKDAGQLLPVIIRNAENKHARRSLPREERDRLNILRKVADSIESWKDRSDSGGGALRENVTVRLEPYCDIGLLMKPDRDRYEYRVTPALATFLGKWASLEDTDNFLEQRFFNAVATAWGLTARPATDEEATVALVQANEDLKSPLGYAPIVDMGLLAGLRLLCQQGQVQELGQTQNLLKRLQKARPNFVRFTVDRMGRAAYAKFLKPTASSA